MNWLTKFQTQLREPIDSFKNFKKPTYTLKQIELIRSIQLMGDIDQFTERIEQIIFKDNNPDWVYLACIFVERYGIPLIIRNSFQKLIKSLHTLLTNLTQKFYAGNITQEIVFFFSSSLQVISYICQKKFFPIHADRGTLELENIHEINKYLIRHYELDPINISIEQQEIDGIFVQVNLIVKENTRKYILLKRKEERDKKLNKLGSIIESKKDEDDDEKYEENEFKQRMQASSKIIGKQLDQGNISTAQQILKQKISIYMSYNQLKIQILDQINQNQQSRLFNDTLQFLTQQLSKLMNQILDENQEITEDLNQIILQQKQALDIKYALYVDSQIQDRIQFYYQEFIRKPKSYECSFLTFLYPFIDQKVIEQEILTTMCRYLNESGGFIFIGINEGNQQVAGINLEKQEKKDLKLFLFACTKKIIPLFDSQPKISFIPVYQIENDLEINNLFIIRIVINQGSQLNQVYAFLDDNQQLKSSFQMKDLASQNDIEMENDRLKQFPRQQMEPLKYYNIADDEITYSSTIKNLRAKGKKKQIDQENQLQEEERKSIIPVKQESPSKDTSLTQNKNSQLNQSLIESKKLEIYLYEKHSEEELHLILMQLLDDKYFDVQSYVLKKIEDDYIQIISVKKLFYNTIKRKIMQNQRFIKQMQSIHQIISENELIYQVDKPNQIEQQSQIANTQIIILIGFNSRKQKKLTNQISYILKLEQINVISIDLSKQYSMTILTKDRKESEKFAKALKCRPKFIKSIDQDSQFQVGYFSNKMKIQFVDYKILENLKQWNGIQLTQVNKNQAELTINSSMIAMEVYEYLKQYQSLETTIKIYYQPISL